MQLFLVCGRTRVQLGDGAPTVVDETDLVYFELREIEGTAPSAWRLRFGDVLPDHPLGDDFDEVIRWKRAAWFDCCRGAVSVSLERHDTPDASAHAETGWEAVFSAQVEVRPSKLTDDEWQTMRADLESVAMDLANDLVGKASAGVARAMRVRSPLDDLAAARRLLVCLDRAVEAIGRQPHSELRAETGSTARAPRRLNAATLRQLLQRGVDPRRYPTHQSALVKGRQVVATTDIAEHRAILGTLQAAVRTLRDGERRAHSEIVEINADRRWRERPGDLPGASLFDRFDAPRIRRLQALLAQSAALRGWAETITQAPVLVGLRAEPAMRPSPITRYRPAYGLALRACQEWRADGRVQIDVGEMVRRKDTNRMYEQWVFLQIAAGLRALGFVVDREAEVFRHISSRRYVLDLPRGAMLAFEGPSGMRVDIRYEPWIRPQDAARRIGDPFYHGLGNGVAWSPDILLTLQSLTDAHARAVVLDAKYARRVQGEHWSGVRKYIQIRRLSDGGSPVRQIWIVAPGVDGIAQEDGSSGWAATGGGMLAESPVVQGTIGLRPGGMKGVGNPVAPVLTFLEGLLA